ncbi:MAG TPA: hypothetical protein VIP48_12060 [Streptosporangiaceae bacterium]
MRKQIYFAVAAAGAMLSALAALPASAATTDVLTSGSLAGTNVAVGDVITSSLASGTTANFYSSSTGTSGVTCSTSSFTGTVLTNPAASGTATESVTDQEFSDCSSNVVGVLGVTSVTVQNLPFSAAVDDSTDTITITGTDAAPIETTVVLSTLLGSATCVYEADADTVTGAVSNTDNSITFTNQQFDLQSGSSLCFANGFFSATYAPVQDSTAGSAAVFVN